MNLLKKIITSISKKKIPVYQDVIKKANLHELCYSELNPATCQNLYQKIYTSEIDALIVKDFVSLSEINFLTENIESISKLYPNFTDIKRSGYTLGKTLFETENIDAYKKLADEFQASEHNIYGFGMNERICKLLKIISNTKNVSAAIFNDGQKYLGSSIRVFRRKQQGLVMHSDLQVHKVSKESEEIMTTINPETILSAYISIQKSEQGGRLFLSDCSLKNTPSEISCLKDTDYQKIIDYVQQFPVSVIDPPLGSLILFDAGQRWHKIEPIQGAKDRITVGCFNGYSKINDEIYIWS